MNEIEKQFCTALENYLQEENQIDVLNEDGNKRYTIITKKNLDCYLLKTFHMVIKDKSWNMPDREVSIGMVTDQNPTYAILGYIPDFLITSEVATFAIEIDGHEWHEKTKEQAASDKRRERALLKSNVIPVRFTGSEVYHSAVNCVKEVMEIVAEFEYACAFESYRKTGGSAE